MTRQELINRVKVKIDELTPIDGLIVPIGLSEDKPIDSFVEGLLDESGKEVLLTAPLERMAATSLNVTAVENKDGSGSIVLPDDFVRLVSFKMKEWERPVLEFASGKMLYRQYNKFTRGGVCKPVCILSHIGNNRVIEYYSVKSSHQVEHFLYIKNVPAESIAIDLQDVVTWFCASMVLQIVGKDNEASVAHEKGVSLL